MALTPTEREEHFFKAMVDAADGNTLEELEPTERREHWYKEIIDVIKAGGGSGGGDVVVAHITRESGQFVCDMTYEEMESAINDGKTVLCQIGNAVSAYSYGSAEFVTISAMENILTYANVLFSDDGITVVPKNYSLTPAT